MPELHACLICRSKWTPAWCTRLDLTLFETTPWKKGAWFLHCLGSHASQILSIHPPLNPSSPTCFCSLTFTLASNSQSLYSVQSTKLSSNFEENHKYIFKTISQCLLSSTPSFLKQIGRKFSLGLPSVGLGLPTILVILLCVGVSKIFHFSADLNSIGSLPPGFELLPTHVLKSY